VGGGELGTLGRFVTGTLDRDGKPVLIEGLVRVEFVAGGVLGGA
jgi:hypothetical protein